MDYFSNFVKRDLLAIPLAKTQRRQGRKGKKKAREENIFLLNLFFPLAPFAFFAPWRDELGIKRAAGAGGNSSLPIPQCLCIML